MQDKTVDKQREILDTLDELGVEVTRIEMSEFIRGDPTSEDAKVTGAEVTLTAFVSFAAEPDDEGNPYRVK